MPWTLLEAKAEQQGRRVVAINRWLLTSQACSTCGHREGKNVASICSELIFMKALSFPFLASSRDGNTANTNELPPLSPQFFTKGS
ncbi:zinc ribbon domain-containing protein [Candidatus Synechococcus spongiarum]|uniref:zinc ribbon domain-containing protein n=1 Tax=Candidatus Synechococcus spongiarum TaxID=431041 RepID=UPI000945B111